MCAQQSVRVDKSKWPCCGRPVGNRAGCDACRATPFPTAWWCTACHQPNFGLSSAVSCVKCKQLTGPGKDVVTFLSKKRNHAQGTIFTEAQQPGRLAEAHNALGCRPPPAPQARRQLAVVGKQLPPPHHNQIRLPAEGTPATRAPAAALDPAMSVITFNLLNEACYTMHAQQQQPGGGGGQHYVMPWGVRLHKLLDHIDNAIANDPSLGFICFQEWNSTKLQPVAQLLNRCGFYLILSSADRDCVAIAYRAARFSLAGPAATHQLTGFRDRDTPGHKDYSPKTGMAALVQTFIDTTATTSTVTVVSAHLLWCSSTGERTRSDLMCERVDELFRAVSSPALQNNSNVIIAGDFNIWAEYKHIIHQRMGGAGWTDATAGLAWTAKSKHTRQLDYVLFRGPGLRAANRPAEVAAPRLAEECLTHPLLIRDGETVESLNNEKFPSDHGMIKAFLLLGAGGGAGGGDRRRQRDD